MSGGGGPCGTVTRPFCCLCRPLPPWSPLLPLSALSPCRQLGPIRFLRRTIAVTFLLAALAILPAADHRSGGRNFVGVAAPSPFLSRSASEAGAFLISSAGNDAVVILVECVRSGGRALRVIALTLPSALLAGLLLLIPLLIAAVVAIVGRPGGCRRRRAGGPVVGRRRGVGRGWKPPEGDDPA